MATKVTILLLSLALVGHSIAAFATEDLGERYHLQRMLDSEGQYVLYWSFDLEAKTIDFAVNVSTTGWVGFGLSPNGQMPLSDVVIGWVNDQGDAQFHVSFDHSNSSVSAHNIALDLGSVCIWTIRAHHWWEPGLVLDFFWWGPWMDCSGVQQSPDHLWWWAWHGYNCKLLRVLSLSPLQRNL